MSMNSTVLIAAIKKRMTDELGYDFSKAPSSKNSMDIIIEETIKHIQTFAVVNTNVNTVVTGTLTPPTAVAGTGIGTGTGKVN